MTIMSKPAISDALRRAAVRATLAPSVHNTQPWRFVLNVSSLEIHADWDRQLKILDPAGRQLLISCGCALFNARVVLAAMGFDAAVERFPDPTHSSLLARLTVSTESSGAEPIAAYDATLELRQTNRRRFADDAVPAEVVEALIAAARSEHAQLMQITTMEHLLITASLSNQADRLQNSDPAYRAEIRRWTTDDAGRRDGVPARAVPHVDGNSRDEIPMRDFDSLGSGGMPPETHSSLHQCLLLLGTVGDSPETWLRAGEALERVLLEVTRQGYVASPLTQVTEMPPTRSMLRHELAITMMPHLLLRVGRAPLAPGTRRRRLVDVIKAAD
jgi:hypothetical protein